MGILSQLKVQQTVILECGEQLVELDNSEFVLTPMYYKWNLSGTDVIYLRSGVVEKLRQARKFLPVRWNFKIWDGFRTVATQKLLYENYWKELKNQHFDWSDECLAEAVETFIAPPSTNPLLPAPHNTGAAIDLTIVDENNDELPMGTVFDEFSSKSFTDNFKEGRNYEDRIFHKNRMLLVEIMSKVGFVNYPQEWWHFSYGDQFWAAETNAECAIYGSVEL